MKTLNIDAIKDTLKEKATFFANKIQPVYASLDWYWASRTNPGTEAVPTVDDIEATILSLIDDIDEADLTLENPRYAISTGGLTVGYEIIRNIDELVASVEPFIKFTFEEIIYEDLQNCLIDVEL